MAVEAAENCLRKVPHLRSDIGVLLFVGVFRSGFSPEPSFASILAGRLFPDRRDTNERSGILAFDVHGGQGGFLTACETFRSMAVHRHLRAGIIIAAEFENNRLTGYPELGVAEVASATIVTPDRSGNGSGFRIDGSEFFSFDQYEDVRQIDFRCAKPAYTILQSGAHYEECLRECICSAVRSYVARIGIPIPTFAKFYFPQISSSFLHALGQDLDIPRDRIVDITINGRDLYTSSLPCLLEETERGGAAGAGQPCLAVSAGPGINVICAVVWT